jgi:hypothetical protein
MNSIVGLTAARRSGATGERTTTERPPPVKAPATTAAPTTSSAQLDLDILPIGSPDLLHRFAILTKFRVPCER